MTTQEHVPADPVAEHLNAEMRAEMTAGQPWSFPAGSA